MNKSQEQARSALLRLIEPIATRIAPKTTVVFDGQERGSDPILSTKQIDVLYAPVQLTADGLIERLVAKSKEPRTICVVTSDRLEQQTVSSAGAQIQSTEDFLRQQNRADKITYSTRMRSGHKPKLGDIFPDGL
jgi:predicted RNA-binding protein with PIN domain